MLRLHSGTDVVYVFHTMFIAAIDIYSIYREELHTWRWAIHVAVSKTGRFDSDIWSIITVRVQTTPTAYTTFKGLWRWTLMMQIDVLDHSLQFSLGKESQNVHTNKDSASGVSHSHTHRLKSLGILLHDLLSSGLLGIYWPQKHKPRCNPFLQLAVNWP